MSEKVTNVNGNQFRTDRFEFVLTINEFIVCQRYFYIKGFNYKAFSSKQIRDCTDYCMSLIENDLKMKTHVYNSLCAPQIFEKEEDMTADNMPGNSPYAFYAGQCVSFVLCKDTENVYTWDGETFKKFEGYFNKAEYLGKVDEEAPCEIKFAILDHGKEVCSKVIDGNQFPRYIRNNINISNSPEKYVSNEFHSQLDAYITSVIKSVKFQDLIPIIVREICKTCSFENDSDYTMTDEYYNTGEDTPVKTYNLNVSNANYRYFKSLEKVYAKKTEQYFKNLA